MPLIEVEALERSDRARWQPLISDRGNDEREPKNPNPSDDEDRAQFLPVGKLKNQYLDYLTSKTDEINEQKESRHYYHGAHYTADQLRILRSRHQPATTWNRIARKINGIVGLIERLRSDPKALANHPKSEAGADIATHSIRTVLDGNEWKTADPWCLLQCGIEGLAGVQMVLSQGDKGDPDISLAWVIGDEYFYEPHSYRFDFSDSRYEGIAKWVDLDEAIELFPDKEEDLRSLVSSGSDMTTHADREFRWVLTSSRKLRLVEHWYKHRGKWCWAFYVGEALLDEGVSPFLDEKGKTTSSFLMFSAAVDHDGDRYGFIRNLKGPQDTLNHGKSKTLHLANTKLVQSEKGAVDDVEIARREVTRPDGWLETNPGKAFQVVDTKADLATFVQFTEDAKNELDQYANINVASIAGTALTNISGRAIELLRQPGMAELGPFILAYRGWKLRVFRAVWNAVQRHWTGERFIRVGADPGLSQFIQLNGLGLDQMGRPVIVNHVGALDVDITLEEGPDIASMMQDMFDALKGFPPGSIPPQVLIEMNPNIPRSDKDRFIKMLQPQQQQPDPMQEMAKRLSLESLAGKNAETAAKTRKLHAGVEESMAKADKTRVETHTEGVKGATMLHGADLEAAQFERDTLKQAHDIFQSYAQQAHQQQAQPQQRTP